MIARILLAVIITITASLDLAAQEVLQRLLGGYAAFDGSRPHTVDLGNGRFLLATGWTEGSISEQFQLTPWTIEGVSTSRRYQLGQGVLTLDAIANGSDAFVVGVARFVDGVPGSGVIMRTSADGRVAWMRAVTVQGTSIVTAESITMYDGDLYVAGTALRFEVNREYRFFWVARVKTDGSLVWVTRLGNDDDESAAAVVAGSDGVYVVGTRNYETEPDGFVARLSHDGDLQWTASIDPGVYYGATSAVAHPDGGVVVGGYAGRNDSWRPSLAHIDSAGSVVWASRFAPVSRSSVFDLTIDSRNRIVALIDIREGPNGPSDVATAFFDTDGTMTALRQRVTYGSQVPTAIDRSGERLLITVRESEHLVLLTTPDGHMGCDEIELDLDDTTMSVVTTRIDMARHTQPDWGPLEAVESELSTTHADLCRIVPRQSTRRLRSIGFSDDNDVFTGPRHVFQTPHGLRVLATTTLQSIGTGTTSINVDAVPATGRVHLQGSSNVSAIASHPTLGTIVAGMAPDGTGQRWYITAYDSTWRPRWSRYVSRSPGKPGLAVLPNGNIIVAGKRMDSLDRGAEHGFSMLCFNPAGTIEWSRRVADTLHANVDAVATDAEGFVLAGEGFTVNGAAIYVARFTAAGELIWNHRFELGVQRSSVRSLLRSDNGDITVVGHLSLGSGSSDVTVMRISADGTPQWARAFGSPGYMESVGSAVRAVDGQTIIGLDIDDYAGSPAAILSVGDDGELRWARRYGSMYDGRRIAGVESITRTTGSDLVALVGLHEPVSPYHFALLHIGPTGEAACSTWTAPMETFKLDITPLAVRQSTNNLDTASTVDAFVALVDHSLLSGEICLGAPLGIDGYAETIPVERDECVLTPNVVRAGERISISSNSLSSNVTLHTVQGEAITGAASTSRDGVVTIDTSTLAPGHYVITVDTAGVVRTCHLVVH